MNPIQRLIALNPSSAVLDTRTAESSEYDPTAPEPDVDDEDEPAWVDVLTPLIGAFSGVKVEGADYTATLTIAAEDRPAELEPDNTRVVLQQGEYGIKAVRPRYNFGDINGYTLELGL